MTQPGVLLYFEDEAPAAKRLAEASGLVPQQVHRHRFPDGEMQLTLPAHLPPRVVLLRSLHQPHDKLTELLLAAPTARQLGARHLSLVAPYLAYMRQDKAFAQGQAVSQRIVGAWLANLFDAVITVDPHLHRVSTLAEALPACDLRGQAVVLLDDVASSGHTLATAAALALAAGAASVDVAVTHALLGEDALQRIHQAGVSKFWSTDSVAHASNVVGLATLLSEALMRSSRT